MLPPLENGLVLLEHINQHLEEGLGLRQILDWALYVDKDLDDDAWEHTFAPVVRRLGLERLTITVTRMCQLYLGLRPDITWCASADEKLCDSLMNYIMEQGNFFERPYARCQKDPLKGRPHGRANFLKANGRVFPLQYSFHTPKAISCINVLSCGTIHNKQKYQDKIGRR